MRVGLIFFIFLLSCNSPKVIKRPVDLLSKSDLTSLIIELETLEAYYNQNHKRPILYQEALDSSIQMILSKHKISKASFSNSIDYYSQFPDSIYNLYESSLDSVNNLINSY